MTPLPPGLWVPPTVPAMLDRAVAHDGNATALIAGDIALDYATYGRCVAALAARIGPGGTVVLVLRNSIALAIALFAIHRAGAISAALNPDYTARELAPMIGTAAPALVVVHDDLADLVAPLVPAGATVLTVGNDRDFVDRLARGAPVERPVSATPDAIAVLQFTGGTTGRAKGVELTQAAVATNVAQREAVLPTDFGDERVLCFMPMFHSFAAAMCVHLTAYAAGTLIILPRYRPDWVIDAVRRHRITRLPAGPTVFNGLLGYDGLTRDAVSSLRCAWSGSAPLSRETLARWNAATGVPIYEGYGQSEAGPVLTYQGPAFTAKPGSVGRALPGTEVRIAGDGEIVARGPQVMRGYRGDAEATADALRDGWLHTGDMGRIDADGDLFVEDRKKDMVIVGGFNVYAISVEEQFAGVNSVAAPILDHRARPLGAVSVTGPAFRLTEQQLHVLGRDLIRSARRISGNIGEIAMSIQSDPRPRVNLDVSLRCVANTTSLLGEGPVWLPDQEKLLWVDILGPAIHITNPLTGQTERFDVDELTSVVVPSRSGGFVTGTQTGIYRQSLHPLSRQLIGSPESDKPGNRFNDGKCDAMGRFWAGTFAIDATPGSGSLYCVETDGRIRRMPMQ